MKVVQLLVHLEGVGGRFCYQNGFLRLEGTVPEVYRRWVIQNRNLLLRYYRIRDKALMLQKQIDPDDDRQMLPEEERFRLLRLFEQYRDEAERVEETNLKEAERRRISVASF